MKTTLPVIELANRNYRMKTWTINVMEEVVLPFYKSNCPALMAYCQMLDAQVVKPIMENAEVRFGRADIWVLEIPKSWQL